MAKDEPNPATAAILQGSAGWASSQAKQGLLAGSFMLLISAALAFSEA